jgi:hypothetical protein
MMEWAGWCCGCAWCVTRRTCIVQAHMHGCIAQARGAIGIILSINDTSLYWTPACANSMHKAALACIRLISIIGPQAHAYMHKPTCVHACTFPEQLLHLLLHLLRLLNLLRENSS